MLVCVCAWDPIDPNMLANSDTMKLLNYNENKPTGRKNINTR